MQAISPLCAYDYRVLSIVQNSAVYQRKEDVHTVLYFTQLQQYNYNDTTTTKQVWTVTNSIRFTISHYK